MQGVREARITAWWDRAVDIIPKTGGKGAAIGKILEYYHFAKEEAMAFGDSRRAPAGNCGGSPFEII